MKFSENGFWVEKKEDTYVVGLSVKGQDDLGDVAFVEFLADKQVSPDDSFIGVEASKAVTELSAPLIGDVVMYHEALLKQPDLLNSVDVADNWIVVLNNVNEADYLALLDEAGL